MVKSKIKSQELGAPVLHFLTQNKFEKISCLAMWQVVILIAMFFFVSLLVHAPQNMQVLNSMESSLAVSWDPVTDVNNYLLTCYAAGYEMLVKQIHMPKEQLSYEIVRFHPRTTYNVMLPSCEEGDCQEASTGRSR